MSHRSPFSPLAALLLASLTLAGCGGGDAEAPPTPVGSLPASQAPDTTAPTVIIANDVAAATATGPVTFSFVFSEDVGVSFDASDVVVTGGTAGAFTRLSGTQATLVVTPTVGVAGTLNVSVAAGKFSDIAGNANTASASASKPYIATQVITFAGPGNQTLGVAPAALSATSTSGLAVSIASSTASVCTVSGTTLTLVAAGSCTLTATQAGNATFAAATPVARTFTVGSASPTLVTIARANAVGTPSYDATGKAQPAGYTTGGYSANAGEASWWGGNYPEQIQAGYGFSKTNAAQWGFGLFIANGGTGWDLSAVDTYHVTLGTNAECAGVCKVTLRMVSASNASCVADAKVTLTAADITTAYAVPLSRFTVTGCTTNTVAAFKALKVAELHFQMLRADMQFTTSGDPTLFPNGLGVGGNIYFDVAPVALTIVRANAVGTPSYDGTGKAQPAGYTTGGYSANAGEASWWGGNYPEQIQAGYGFSKTNAAQWGFGLFIANGGTGWDLSAVDTYHVTLGTNAECAGVCKVTLRMVSASNASCVADAKVTLTAADITTAYAVPLSRFTVTGCTTNTVAAFKALKVAELHFQMLRADMQFTTSGDPTLFPNGLGMGGNIYFD